MGTWHCSGCRKACKVTVSKFHVAEATVGNVTVTAAVPAEVTLAEYTTGSIEILKGMAPAVQHPEVFVPGVPIAG